MGKLLFFGAEDGPSGVELWKLRLEAGSRAPLSWTNGGSTPYTCSLAPLGPILVCNPDRCA